MERMRLRVDSVRVEGDLGVARVVAFSARKVGARPVARITLEITLRVLEGEPDVSLWRRARDLALDFLDPA
jgi:hypothetical protein